MKFIRLSLCVICFGSLLIACKSDPKKEEVEVAVEVPKTENSAGLKEELNSGSLIVKAMSTKDTKTFTSALVTTGLTDLLNSEGPYTLFVPSNEAFDGLNEADLKYYLNPDNKDAFGILLKNHIIEGDLGSAEILQETKNKDLELKTLGGAVLMASMKDGKLFLKDAQDNVATLDKTDILASNGKLHILDKVLNVEAK